MEIHCTVTGCNLARGHPALARPTGQKGLAGLLGAAWRARARRGHHARRHSRATRWCSQHNLTGGLGVLSLVAGARVVYREGAGQGEAERCSPRQRHNGEAEEGLRGGGVLR
jgi:hypothetical protein